jgi:hypothetical protein
MFNSGFDSDSEFGFRGWRIQQRKVGPWEFDLRNELLFEFDIFDRFTLFHRFDNAAGW